MRVLFISTDKNIFNPQSEVSWRMGKFASLLDSLTIIVFAKSSEGHEKQIRGNLTLLPTNSRNRWRYISDAVKMGKELSAIDLVSAQDPFECGIAGYRIALARGTRLEVQVHTDFLSRYFSRESLLNWIRIFVAYWILPKADGVRVVSKRIADCLPKEGIRLRNAPVILPVFTDLSRYRSASRGNFLQEKYPQFDFHILVASRLVQEKNIEGIIHVFMKVLSSHPKTGLIIVGDGPLMNDLKEHVHAHALSQSVIFEGWQNNISPHLLSADLFVSNSKYEGFGLSLLEAASAGCPLLTTDVGIVGEVLNHDNALIIPVRNSTALTEKLLFAISNRDGLPKLGANARTSVEPFLEMDREEYFQKFSRVWEEIIAAK